MEEIISEIRKIYDENKNFKQKVDIYESELNELKNITEELKNKNYELVIKVKELEDKNNSKSSKLIWENTQNVIKEKDIEIDKLKKDILYYERQNLIKSKQSVNDKQENITVEKKQENITVEKKQENVTMDEKEENVTIEKKPKKSKKKINIINTQNNIDDLEKDLLSIK
jgi:hypothetical protein